MKSISMRALFYAAFGYLLAGLGVGLFFREFTQANDFPDSEFTQLAVVHTHLLTLGFIVLLLVLALERLFALSASKLFGWFFWLYNAGVILTAAMMVWHGTLTVLGRKEESMISGIAGLGHILLTIALILFMLALGGAISKRRRPAPAEPDVPSLR
jgi:cbb3-type cytochrome oxidase subunit 1